MPAHGSIEHLMWLFRFPTAVRTESMMPLQGPYYIWAASLAGALYYGYGSYWFTAGVTLLALWNMSKRRGAVNAVASLATIGVSAYVAYHDATNLWVMILVSAQIAWSGVRTLLGGINIAQ